MPGELKAEWLDTVAQIDAVNAEIQELAVHKQGQSVRAHLLVRHKARLETVKLEWENLIRESQSRGGQ